MTIFEKMVKQPRILPHEFLKPFGKTVYIYDIETYKNYFGVAFRTPNPEEPDRFFRLINKVIPGKDGAPDAIGGVVVNEMDELFKFIAERRPLLCGYNNYSFDDTLLKIVYGYLTGKPDDLSSLHLWQIVQNLIFKRKRELRDEEIRYLNTIRYKTPLPLGIKSIDLLAMFFYNPQTTKSLKELGIALNLPFLQDLPHKFEKNLTEEEIAELEAYCSNDLHITAGVFNHFEAKILLFEQINTKCNGKIDVHGSTEPRAAVRWLMHEYEQLSGLQEWQVKNMVDFPLSVPICEVIPPVEFELPQLQNLYAKLQAVVLELNPEKIEAARGDLRNVHYLTKDLTNIVEINGKQYKTGVGGLHSVDMPETHVAREGFHLLELDVTSYYPNLIRARGIFPRHLTNQWNELFCSSIGERVEEKRLAKEAKTPEERKRHKQNSDALKLRLNGTFGQLLFNRSSVYCPFSGYNVTLSGQLYLLKLVEMLEIAGFRCLSANTDGVILEVSDAMLPVMYEIKSQWEKLTDQVLEETRFRSIHRHDVNNYCAVLEDGSVKTNGSFRDYVSLQKKNDAQIIQKAVVEFFRTGTPVERTIRDCDNISAFIYYYKCTSKFAAFPVVSGRVPKPENRNYTQKTFRWYKSTEERSVEYYRERIAGATVNTNIGDVGKIQKSEGARLANVLPEEFPADVDFEPYINKAQEIIARCSMLEIARQHEEKAEQLREMGLFPIPKQGKVNPKGYKYRGINHRWSWVRNDGKEGANHDGYYISGAVLTGIVEGEDTKTGVVDIDRPEDAIEFLDIWNTAGNPGLTVFHGANVTFEDVKQGKSKFKVVFKVDDPDEKHRNSTATMLKKYGVEYLFGKPAVMWGKYSKDDPLDFYHPWQGEPALMPPTIEEWILDKSPAKRKPKALTTTAPEEETAEKIREIGNPAGDARQRANFQEDIARLYKTVSEVLPDWTFEEENLEPAGKFQGEFKLFGRCPFEDEHTNASNNRNFDFTLKPGEFIPFCSCFHESCKTSINALRKHVNRVWGELRVQEIQTRLTARIAPNTAAFDVGDISTLDAAFESDAKLLLITAPTGSGKTYRAALHILNRCRESEKTIFAAANKLEMRQVEQYLRILAGDEYPNLFVQMLESGERLQQEQGEATDDDPAVKIARNTLCVLTNHSYFLRKGEFSDLYYSVLSWVENNDVDVIIDEFDNYVEKSTYHFPIGARYIRRNRKGMNELFVKATACPKFSGNGSCQNCEFRIWQEIDTNAYHLPVLMTRGRVSGDDWKKDGQKLIDLPKWSFNRYSDTLEAMPVPTRGKNGERFLTEYRNIETHSRYWEGKKFKFYLEDGEKYDIRAIFRDFVETSYFPTVAKQFATLDGEKITQNEILKLTEEDVRRVVFPHLPCDVPTISCKDLSVLRFLSVNATRLIMTTATISPASKEYVFDALPGLSHVEIEESEQGVEDLLIIGIPDNLQLCRKGEVFTAPFAKFGDVLIFQSTAARALSLFTKLPNDFPACLYRENSILRQEKFTKKDVHHIITNSRGALGRGVSLPEVRTTLCDCLAYKPTGAFDLNRFDPEEVAKKQDLDRLQTVLQNFGRSLRGTGRKVHVLYNATIEDVQFFAKQFRPMVKGEITAEIVERKELLQAAVVSFLDGGKIEVTEEEKPIVNVDDIKENLQKCVDDGLKWSQARKRANIDREAKKLPPARRKEFVNTLKQHYSTIK